MWIFGYGSLIWKVDFPFRRKLFGFIKGYERRFWQASLDHRGTPEQPGRVVTLVPTEDPEECVWGVAYELSEQQANTTLQRLDVREQCGYVRHQVIFYPQPGQSQSRSNIPRDSSSPGVDAVEERVLGEDRVDGEASIHLTIYVAAPDNPFFVGPVSDEDVAEVMVSASGQSGANSEYLYKLVDSLRTHFPHVHEPHLASLERAVRARERAANSV